MKDTFYIGALNRAIDLLKTNDQANIGQAIKILVEIHKVKPEVLNTPVLGGLLVGIVLVQLFERIEQFGKFQEVKTDGLRKIAC